MNLELYTDQHSLWTSELHQLISTFLNFPEDTATRSSIQRKLAEIETLQKLWVISNSSRVGCYVIRGNSKYTIKSIESAMPNGKLVCNCESLESDQISALIIDPKDAR